MREQDQVFRRYRHPFAQVPWDLLTSDLSSHAVRLFALLDGHANRKTGECFPAHPTLAKELHTSKSTVRRAIKELSVAGWIETKERTNQVNARIGTNYYLYDIPRFKKCSDGCSHMTTPVLTGERAPCSPVSTKPYEFNQKKSHSSSEEASSPLHPGHTAARGPGNAGRPKGDGSKEGPAVEPPATATEAAVDAGGAPVPPVPAAPLPVDAAAERAEERGGANPQSTLGVARGGVPVAARHQDAANAAAQASLFGLHGEDSEAPSAQGRAPFKDATGRPGTHALLRRHAALFAEKIGSSLAIGWAKDGALAKKLLQVYDAETVEELQDRFFTQGPDSYAAKVGYTFGEFYREVPALLVAQKEAERRRHLTREQERSKALLIQQKMPPETAADLALRFSYTDIQRQVRAMQHRKGIKNPAGALKKAIEEGWPVPDEASGGEGRYRPYPLPESEATAHAT